MQCKEGQPRESCRAREPDHPSTIHAERESPRTPSRIHPEKGPRAPVRMHPEKPEDVLEDDAELVAPRTPLRIHAERKRPRTL